MKVILTAHVVLALHPGALHHTVLNLAGLTLTTEAPASGERGGEEEEEKLYRHVTTRDTDSSNLKDQHPLTYL